MIEDIIISLLWNILLMLITLGVGLLTIWLKKRLGLEGMKKAQAEWENMQELAMVAVRYAEQAYMKYGGATKKEKALAFLSRELALLGLKISEDTIDALIEAALREIKDQFGEEWAKLLPEEDEEEAG
jgi:LL-H family phage holin